MLGIERFATQSVAPGERLAFWNRLSAETYQGLTVDADRALAATMWRWRLGDIVMLRPRSEAAVVQRWLASRPGAAAQDRVILHMQHRGRMLHSQFDRAEELQPSDFALCAAGSPYRLDISDAHEALVVELPRAPLAARIGDLDSVLARRIAGTDPGTRLLHDFLLSLWQQGDQSDADPDWQQGVADVLMNLIALAVRGGGREQSPGGLVGRLHRLTEARLSDPELGTILLAHELGLSPRTIQNAFAAIATTPSAYILERRLQRACARLSAGTAPSITDLAFDLGFNDSAYFTRCFRHRFGVSPTAYSAAADCGRNGTGSGFRSCPVRLRGRPSARAARRQDPIDDDWP